MKIPIGIVDDKTQNRLSLAERINYSDDIAVVLTAANGNDFLDQMKSLTADKYPAVVLMDIEMPGLDGIETVRAGKQLYPSVKFLMLTVFDDDDKIFEAIKAGAGGYLLKDEKVPVIIDCIEQLQEVGGAPMSPRIARKAFDLLMKASLPARETEAPAGEEKNDYRLSGREIEVLKLLVDGFDYKAIAEKLFLSSHTVRKHIANIYHKLHVTSKAQAIKLATNNKLI
ncbi:MAG: response regulator transcription factor [Bacteroidetes bacterium]|nr:response regulator transcription factor [Bacteroidota bacterium]